MQRSEVARLPWAQEVVGSNPAAQTIYRGHSSTGEHCLCTAEIRVRVPLAPPTNFILKLHRGLGGEYDFESNDLTKVANDYGIKIIYEEQSKEEQHINGSERYATVYWTAEDLIGWNFIELETMEYE